MWIYRLIVNVYDSFIVGISPPFPSILLFFISHLIFPYVYHILFISFLFSSSPSLSSLLSRCHDRLFDTNLRVVARVRYFAHLRFIPLFLSSFFPFLLFYFIFFHSDTTSVTIRLFFYFDLLPYLSVRIYSVTRSSLPE